MLIPPPHFAMAEADLYHCTSLDALHFPFVATLQLSALLWVNDEAPPQPLRAFLAAHGVVLHHLPVPPTPPDHWAPLAAPTAARALRLVLDATLHPLLVVDASALVLGMLRHALRWNYAALVHEYRLTARSPSYRAELFLDLLALHLEGADPTADSTPTAASSALPVPTPAVTPTAAPSPTPAASHSLSASPQIPAHLLRMAQQRVGKRPTSVIVTDPSSTGPTPAWKLYAPRPDAPRVRSISTTIRVRLPPESALPNWFLALRARCELSED